MMLHIRKKYKSAIALLLCIGLYLLFCTFSISGKNLIADIYPGISLRYTTPLDYQTIQNARTYASDNESDLSPTFWRQQKSTIQASAEAELLASDLDTICYDGDGFTVWPARFCYGGFPGDLDTGSCVLSTELAWQLWGGLDVVGQTCLIDGSEYTVQGVFEHAEMLALVAVNSTAADTWQNVELSRSDSAAELLQDERTLAETFAVESGLGTPDALVDGSLLQGFTSILSLLPLILIFLVLCFWLILRLKHLDPWKRGALIFLGLLGFSLLLPQLLAFIPAWSTPGKWSDFTYWSDLATQFNAYLQEWFLLPPFLKDAQAKGTLAKLFLSCIAAIPGAAGIWLSLERINKT